MKRNRVSSLGCQRNCTFVSTTTIYRQSLQSKTGEDSYSLEPYQEFKIPKGIAVYIPVVATHRDPKYFPNPAEFIPERFNRDFVDQSVYLAYELGPQNCVGIRFAYFQMKLAMIIILQTYKIEMSERTPKIIRRHKKSLVTRSEAPLYVNLKRA
ncbi:hypothetical protein DMENIID0001_038890 [Sergentomyia squamirostris]